MTTSLAIIDHELPIRSWIRTLIEEHFSWISIIGEADTVSTGLDLIYQKAPEIVLLNVKFKDGSGFELLNQIPGPAPIVIFLSSCGRFAIQAIRQNALDYLCKPIRPQELSQALFRAKGAIAKRWERTAAIQAKPKPISRLAVPTGTGVRYVSYASIQQVVADGSYCEIHLCDEDRPMVVSRKLKELQSVLEPHGFVRPNHSRLVNGRHIEEIQKAHGGALKMKNGEIVSLSRHYKKQALLRLNTQVDSLVIK